MEIIVHSALLETLYRSGIAFLDYRFFEVCWHLIVLSKKVVNEQGTSWVNYNDYIGYRSLQLPVVYRLFRLLLVYTTQVWGGDYSHWVGWRTASLHKIHKSEFNLEFFSCSSLKCTVCFYRRKAELPWVVKGSFENKLLPKREGGWWRRVVPSNLLISLSWCTKQKEIRSCCVWGFFGLIQVYIHLIRPVYLWGRFVTSWVYRGGNWDLREVE